FVLACLEANNRRLCFARLRILVLQSFMLRETDVKDICVELAKEGNIPPTWKSRGGRVKKPNLNDTITLSA
ncbi:MAG: hypothetical protein ACE5DS_05530, partial [Kiloniellaceae bacterium]